MTKQKRKFLIFITIISIMSLIISACEKKEEGIVAKVNGKDITEEEFESEFSIFKDMYKKQFGEEALAQETEENKTFEELLKENVLEKLIVEKIIYDEVEKMNITVTDEEIEEQIDGYKAYLGGEDKYKEFLESNNFTEEFLKENFRKEIMYKKHREDFVNKTDIPEDEIKEYFEENKDSLMKVRASHILVKSEEEGNTILEKLGKGESFSELAATESIDTGSAIKGGDLGYFSRGTMVPEFEEAVFALNIGETSNLVKSTYGYHIIHLEDKKDSYEDLKEDIISILRDQKYFEKLSKLREDANVKIYIDFENKAEEAEEE